MFRALSCALLGVLLACTPSWAMPPHDAINLSQAIVYNSPGDVASWPVTTAITQLTMQPTGSPNDGIGLTFSAQNTWPDYVPPGWDGPLQYTVWAVVKINGQWYTSGFIQMWRGRPNTGAPILTDFAINWAYDGRWGPMAGYHPHVGEQMGFFVTAGNARGVTTVTSVRERSNVVVVNLPANDTGVFTFPDHVRVKTDFDGDGRADLVVYRPSTGTAYIRSTGTGATAAVGGGLSTDVPVPGDYDGDRKTDFAVFRPSTGEWLLTLSATQTTRTIVLGAPGDKPVAGDYDGDGLTDLAVYTPSTGTWTVLTSLSNFANRLTGKVGISSDLLVPGDYDGDGRTDMAVYRASTGSWLMLGSTSGFATTRTVTLGSSGDIPVPADYDGDGVTDIATYRPSAGQWSIVKSSDGSTLTSAWGTSGSDVPLPKHP